MAAIVSETKSVVQHYLVGLVIETVLVAILNSAGLLLLGIEYAILIGITGALLNLIPYIGGLVAVAIPVMVALVTKDSPWFFLYVIGVYYTVQLIDNNYNLTVQPAMRPGPDLCLAGRTPPPNQ